MVDVGERRNLDTLREQVLAVVAHDLRNPMSAMRMTLAMLAKKTEMPLERRLALAERLTGTLGRMEALVNTLVEYARADAGVELRLERSPANLGLIYDRVQVDLDVIYPGRKVRRAAAGQPGGRVGRRPDGTGAVASGGQRAETRPRRSAGPGWCWTGPRPITSASPCTTPGRPSAADLLPLVYEPFTTGAVDKQGRRRAIGLGLFVVRHLVAAHGGHHPADVDRRSGYHGHREPAAPAGLGEIDPTGHDVNGAQWPGRGACVWPPRLWYLRMACAADEVASTLRHEALNEIAGLGALIYRLRRRLEAHPEMEAEIAPLLGALEARLASSPGAAGHPVPGQPALRVDGRPAGGPARSGRRAAACPRVARCRSR